MNTLKLSLENFQSISHGELEFCTGLNFIVGQSNSGKSATFRALKTCLANNNGSQSFIKNGTKQAVVTLEYNGNCITWKRTPKESTYVINGETYIKTGNSNAFKITDNTGFVRDTNDVIMNIEEELQLPFPFGVSKADLFRLYEDVFCVSDSSIILKSAKEEEEKVKDRIEDKENEILKSKRKIEELQKFKEEVDINLLISYKDNLETKRNRLSILKDGLSVIRQAVTADKVFLGVPQLSFSNKLDSYQTLVDCKQTAKRVKQLHTLGKELKEVSIECPSKLEGYEKLTKLQADLSKIEKLDKIEIEQITFEDKLSRYKELSKFQTDLLKVKELDGLKVQQVSFENKLDIYKDLKHYLATLNDIIKKISDAKARLKSIEDGIASKQERLKEFKVCPLCHNPLNND